MGWWPYDEYENASVSELVGKIPVEITGMEPGNDEIRINCSDGSKYMFFHYQDCCEYVRIEDVCGYVDDLLNSPIRIAEKRTDSGSDDNGDSHTWTFYTLATRKGYVDIRWLGESNGYYSEEVDFIKRKETT